MGNMTKKKIGNLDDPKLPYNYSEREYGTVPLDKTRAGFQWVSEIAYKNVHRIVTRGYDTTELMEQGYGLVDGHFLNMSGFLNLLMWILISLVPTLVRIKE